MLDPSINAGKSNMMHKPYPFVGSVLGRERLVAVDIGARHDVPPQWLAIEGHAQFISYEPDPEACDVLKRVYDARGFGHTYKILPVAISGTGGRRTLHVTGIASGASLYWPDTPVNRAYVDHSRLYPIKDLEIETRTLSDTLDEIREPQNDIIKIDVEGAALEVIEGLGDKRLGNVLCLETETGVVQQFATERTFFDIHKFMADRGFELMDVERLYGHLTLNGRADGYHREVFGVHGESPTISRRMLDVQAYYFRIPDQALAGGESMVRRLAAVYATYGFFAEAHNLFERAQNERVMSVADATAARDAVVAWHHSAAVRRLFHRPTPFWALVRSATKMVGMTDRVLDEAWRFGGREVVKKVIQRAREALAR